MSLTHIPTKDLLHELGTRARITHRMQALEIYIQAVGAVAKTLRLHSADIVSTSRKPHLTYARYMAFALMRTLNLSTTTISALFDIHHASVLHGLTRHAQRLLTDPTWQKHHTTAQATAQATFHSNLTP